MTFRHTIALFGAVAALLGTSVIGGPLSGGPAGADGPTCTVSTHITYDPGLLLVDQEVHTTVDKGFSNCVTPGREDIVAGTASASFVGTRSCVQTLESFPTEADITWNTGETSTRSGTTTVNNVAGQVVLTFTGTITAGLFAGSSFTEVVTEPALNPIACLAPPGVTSQSGRGTLIIS